MGARKTIKNRAQTHQKPLNSSNFLKIQYDHRILVRPDRRSTSDLCQIIKHESTKLNFEKKTKILKIGPITKKLGAFKVASKIIIFHRFWWISLVSGTVATVPDSSRQLLSDPTSKKYDIRTWKIFKNFENRSNSEKVRCF